MIALVEIHVKTCRQKHTSCQSDAAETAATVTFFFVCVFSLHAALVLRAVATVQMQMQTGAYLVCLSSEMQIWSGSCQSKKHCFDECRRVTPHLHRPGSTSGEANLSIKLCKPRGKAGCNTEVSHLVSSQMY